MIQMIKQIIEYESRDLTIMMTLKELRVRYKQAAMQDSCGPFLCPS